MATAVGFEPTNAFALPVFKTGSLSRSDIPSNAIKKAIQISGARQPKSAADLEENLRTVLAKLMFQLELVGYATKK